jgi:putative ABC transport system permease protein
MNIFSYAFKSLFYYRKANLATLMGIMVSAAVLTGALILGDSVKSSLEAMVTQRLGNASYAVQTPERLFHIKLASALQKELGNKVVPVLQTKGILLNTEKELRINNANVIGIEPGFPVLFNTQESVPDDGEALISQQTAEKLDLKTGDECLLKIMVRENAPANSPFMADQKTMISLRVKIKTILQENSFGRFSLKSNQVAPHNIFISLSQLSGLFRKSPSANLLLLTHPTSDELSIEKINEALRKGMSMEDAGLYFDTTGQDRSVFLKSDRVFMDRQLSASIDNELPGKQSIYTYLVNSIALDDRLTPYSFISAADSSYLGEKPGMREILVNQWLADDLSAKVGDSVMITYFTMGPMRSLKTDSCRFLVKKVLPNNDPRFCKQLMPDFPGMTESGSCSDWKTGVPINLDLIRDKDEEWWNLYKGTPKAFISLETGQELWKNHFGEFTSFRLEKAIAGMDQISKGIVKSISPLSNGFRIENVLESGNNAASNSTDFGELFLSLGFFIMLAGIILISLLFGLHLSVRTTESALLTAIGFPRSIIYRLFLYEALLLSISGSIIGACIGIFYNKLMILGLDTLWTGAVGETTLETYVKPATLLLGAGINILVSLITLMLVMRNKLKSQPALSVKGISIVPGRLDNTSGKRSLIISGLVFLLLFAFSLIAGNQTILLSLALGGIFMVVSIIFFSYLLQTRTNRTKGIPGKFNLLSKNLLLKRKRTLASVALLAIGTFTILITGANQRPSNESEYSHNSGTGGFILWAESTLPIREDLNSEKGKEKTGLSEEPVLDNVTFYQLAVVDGDDASCLNLNMVAKPSLVGIVPGIFSELGAFDFEKTSEGPSPWLLLNDKKENIIPAIADQTVITWGLRKKTGDTLLYLSETGQPLKMVLQAGLRNSIFQGNLLISEENLKKYFPTQYKSVLMLIKGPVEKQSEIADRLGYLLGEYGTTLTSTSERLASFNEVQNTYLSVFMLLGGLGVLIGVIGLGIILLKNILERKNELALMQAMGFRNHQITGILVAEHMVILVTGMLVGLLGALIALLMKDSQSILRLPWLQVGSILLLILMSGFLWIWIPAKKAVRANLVEALKNE